VSPADELRLPGVSTYFMVIVAGHITVEPRQRASYLASCVEVVDQARAAAGCIDFAISADLAEARDLVTRR
jgi:quinol monooxygenase YgiN